MGYFNIYGQYVKDDSELYHHGILGMRWDKKNGPPYPLSPGDHSAEEKRLKSQNEGKLESWRSKELASAEKKHAKIINRAEKRVIKARAALDKETNNRRFAKKSRKLDNAWKQKQIAMARKELEKKAIMEMTLDDVKKERLILGKEAALSVLATVGSFALAPATGGLFVVALPRRIDVVETNSRLKRLREKLAERGKTESDILYKDYEEKEKAALNSSVEKDGKERFSKLHADAHDAYEAYKGAKATELPNPKKYDREIDDIGNIIKANNVGLKMNENPSNLSKEATESSRIGITALNKVGRQKLDANDPDMHAWFMYEDQTIGHYEVADLARQGKSVKEIKSILKSASKSYEPLKELDYDAWKNVENRMNTKIGKASGEAIFDLSEIAFSESRRPTGFIEACVEEARKGRSTKKSGSSPSPAYARSLKNSGLTYEQIAKKIGISEAYVSQLLNG